MSEKALQVLLVEDNAGDARLVREMFRSEKPGSVKLTHLSLMSEAVTHLEQGGVDIVLLDMGLPDGHGLDTVRRAHAAAPTVPVIVLTGLDDEALAASAMKEGAQDYLIKGQIENRALPRALRHAIERMRMQTETDAIRTDQIQFKDEFLSHVSHELRSPLTAIYQFATILQDKLAGELNPEQLKYLEIVLRNVKQLQSMINDLLEVTRVQAGKLAIDLQCTSASDAIDYTVNTLQGAAEAKGITLVPDIQNRLPQVCADPIRIRQILIILVDNAIKFTPASGSVKVHARIFSEDPHFVVLEISDTGRGISPDMTERIFERLFRVSESDLAGRQGLGLGLYICKELVERQGGTIWARSLPGQGAVFCVTLPIFSLAKLIAPALRKESPGEVPITLVIIEIGSRTGWLSNELRAEQCHEVRDLLQRCLHSNLDVLLPTMAFAGSVELFFIVAATDEIGGKAMTQRILEQLGTCGHIQQHDLIVSASYRSIEKVERGESESIEDYLRKAANKVQGLVDDEISSRMVEHEQ
jgi:signal transduction histidine kinase